MTYFDKPLHIQRQSVL